MCGAGEAVMEIDETNLIPEDKKRVEAERAKKLGPVAPTAPDLTDKLIQEAARSEEDWAKAKRGRKSTFLTGDSVGASSKTLLGG